MVSDEESQLVDAPKVSAISLKGARAVPFSTIIGHDE